MNDLIAILQAQAVFRLDKPVELSSGVLSHDFVDVKVALAEWSALRLASQEIHAAVSSAGIGFDAVGGLTMGADAIAVGVAATSNTRWFTVRKNLKGHGTTRRIEGARLEPGVRVLVVDDVATTGASLCRACDEVARTGAQVAAAAAVVDRAGVAAAELASREIRFFAIATWADLGIGQVVG